MKSNEYKSAANVHFFFKIRVWFCEYSLEAAGRWFGFFRPGWPEADVRGVWRAGGPGGWNFSFLA